MSYDFSHLRVSATTTVDYPIVEIDTPPGTLNADGTPMRHPVLELAPATDANKPYWGRALKSSGRRQRSRIDEAALAEGREQDLDLFPKFIVKGWRGVFKNGVPMAFSPKECKEFLAALPNWIFFNIRIFVKDSVNFLEDSEPSPEEVEDQKNA